MTDSGPPTRPADDRAQAARAQAAANPGGFVPLLILLLALAAYFGVQLSDALGARDTLRAMHANQQQTVDNAAKLRGSLDALAADTQRLANAGNGNAGVLVEELRKRGVTITVPAPGAPAAPAAASAPK